MTKKSSDRSINFIGWFVLILLLAMPEPSRGGDFEPGKPSKKDKCPVCGMFIHKYPDWRAEIIFKDGSFDFFDGAKDMFKYYLNLKKYNSGKTQKDIEAVYVTEYYDMTMIRAAKAYFVIGSDVYGPMGKELIPFSNAPSAEVFLKDHSGKAILTFEAITPDLMRRLE